jgi:hypothetical protein
MLVDPNFLNSLVKMPGTLETYQYELRKIVEFQSDPFVSTKVDI